MKLNEAVAVRYRRETKAVVVSFADGSQSSWPVRLLEMTKRTDDGYVAIAPNDDELSAVELFGSDAIVWDELGQIFRIEDLQNHIYGRKAWMESLSASVVS
ncbi:hypothetical protein [cf. Phormidesmis sp. LEGE 11477]|uniref:hypothetical protein n=1 Tax=cf. Phormidesmis sp. LEGE 11477 TaxID=1828680 RepID=UPI001880EA72|nr:hypothetical protein [cf. Phormidesmis sp. LEGE 11477]MBE9059854.1 hypothetical protein [cf. Phormidesmis sp. LEGE 11477]